MTGTISAHTTSPTISADADEMPEPMAALLPIGRQRCLAIVPARNEAGRIDRVLAGIRACAPGLPVLVIDDGSTDDTATAARRLGARVVSLPFNLGYGAALHTGYKFARAHGFERVVQMDADGQHDPACVSVLLQAIDDAEADVVIGSRYLLPDGSVRRHSEASGPLRRLGSRLFAFVVSRVSGTRITDPTSGYKAFSRKALDFLTQEGFPDDYPDADVLLALHRSGCRLHEIPVEMHARSGGVSMHGGVRVLYYGYKMSLNLLLTSVRRSSPYRKERRRADTA